MNEAARMGRAPQMLKLGAVLTILSLLLFAWPAWRLADWLQLETTTKIVITLPLFLSQFIARLGLRHRTGRIAYLVRGAADFYLGLAPVILLLVLLGEIAIGMLGLQSAPVAMAILHASVLTGAWGLRRAWRPEAVVVPLSSARIKRPRRFAQISDVHIGSRTSRFLRHIIRRINAERPEFLCITGDFIDQPGVSAEKLRALQDFDGPIYYCIGNHERYEDLEQILERLQSLGVEVLRNRALEADGIQFIGIDDHGDPEQVARVLPFIDVSSELYSILLYHRPHGLEAAHRHGVDLKLSGHTHAGQIVPFHLAVNKVFEYNRGLYQHGDSFLYVNEGTGTWGPVSYTHLRAHET